MKFIYEKYSNSPSDYHKFMLEIIADKFSIYKQNLIICSQIMSDDNVHDLRVAARRFIATMNLYKTIYPTLYFPMIIKMVKKNFKSLGNVRDTHIMLQNCQSMKIQFPIIYDFINYLLAKEKKLIANFSKNLSEVEFNEIEGMMYYLTRILKYDFPSVSPDFTIFENYFDEQLQNIRAIYNQIDYSNTKTIHKFRIATKKYRYYAEVLQSFIPNYQNLYKILVKIQDDAGAIQDSVVFIDKFNYFVNKRHFEGLEAEKQISNVMNYLEEKQHQLISNFKNNNELITSIFAE